MDLMILSSTAVSAVFTSLKKTRESGLLLVEYGCELGTGGKGIGSGVGSRYSVTISIIVNCEYDDTQYKYKMEF